MTESQSSKYDARNAVLIAKANKTKDVQYKNLK
jgi:hypothetical protein